MEYRRELARETGGSIYAFELLTEAEAAQLVAMFRTARQNEKDGLASAITAAITAMPAPLRRITRRLLFGVES
ncbi:hypothetical protein [Nocardia camponoti]|uniref:Uncharacterized protein n=1 Tax=Nocardia camponoti TaxID=1616106 RepID=A0A917QFH3_9NOCA|nr:hypothetical protein [Nocardia camponoti]GGK48054.1 hypothetical protein GCM10011591_19280 [Nocardia camponoti]